MGTGNGNKERGNGNGNGEMGNGQERGFGIVMSPVRDDRICRQV